MQRLVVSCVLALLPTVARADGTGLVFVSHERSDTVVVLDPARDHEVVSVIETCQRPRT